MRRRLTGEPWIDCHICGFSVPLSDAVIHYDSRKWVDRKCADQYGAAEYRERLRLPEDGRRSSPQPVQDQGKSGSSSGFGVYPFGRFPFGR